VGPATAVEQDQQRPGALLVVLPRYIAVGLLSVIVDVGSLTVFHSVLNLGLLLATIIAFAIALVLNYSLNHVWAFDADGLSWHRIFRYGVLVAVNFGLTLSIVTGLSSLGLYYLVAKAIAVVIAAVINFTGYRLWVFK
jgi:putative flippase GtrA